MPFSNTEETSRLSRLSSEIVSWLREIFVVDLGLKLLALAITLGLWFAVTGQRAPATIRLHGVPINFHLPEGMDISNDPVDEVEVTLTGNQEALGRINQRDLIAFINVAQYKPGERVVHLVPDQVTMDLPQGVRLGDIIPNKIPLKLEPRVEREIPIETETEGRVPEGYELYKITVMPDKIHVRGPASIIAALQKAPTETISLDGHTENFSVPQAAINITDPKVIVVDTVVNVSLDIGEQRIEKSFPDVTVRESTGEGVRPQTATVTVYGPRSLLEQLRAEQMQIVLEVGADGSITPHLELPQNFNGRIELRSTKPAGFSIVR